MYNEQLEKLVEMALMDGELTEKEKQVLFKKAEAMGIDLDEFEMVLEAKLFEKQQAMNQSTKASASPKSDKLGDVRKCPACGAIAETFATKCPECGTEFRNIEASQNIVKFFEKLDEVESKRVDSIYEASSHKSNLSFGRILLWLFFWYIMLPFKLFGFIINKSKPAKWSTIDSRKEELIMNFPVTTSREEILEFMTLASSKINSNSYFNLFSEETKYKNTWNKIWLKKIEQIHSKANLAMKNDKKSFEDVIKLTESARHTVKNNNKKVLHLALGFVTIVVALIIWGMISSSIDEGHLKEQKELKSKAESFIKANEYDKAEEVILTMDNENSIVELKSKIQLDEQTNKLQDLEIFLKNKEYSKLKLELEKLTWTKISGVYNYTSLRIERESFKIFLKKKEAINNQLPEKYRIEIETEDSLED